MEERNCKSVRLSLWDYAAHKLEASENDAMDAHLDVCRDCDRCLADVSSLRTGFGHLPVQAVPPLVQTRLLVMASRERSRQLLRLNPGAWLRDKLSSAMMAFDHFLRPFMVPATGGLLSSCLCFSLIAHELWVRPYMLDNDIPIALLTKMAIDDAPPFPFSSKDVTVQVTVDGNVTNYSMAQGSNPTPEQCVSSGFRASAWLLTPSTSGIECRPFGPATKP